MTTYVVTLRATGAEVYRYSAGAQIEWSGFEFATHDHVEVVEVVAPAAAAPRQEWTPVDFLRRFTPAERIGARAARKTDPILDDFYALLEQSPAIFSDDPDVQMGLGYMTQQGLLTIERMTEILNG